MGAPAAIRFHGPTGPTAWRHLISMRGRGHYSSVSCRNREILNPLFANPFGSFDQVPTRLPAVLNHHHHPRVELPLRSVHGGQTRAFGGDHVLDGDLGSVYVGNLPSAEISSSWRR